MKHELPKLPYSYNALEPFIDAKTMEIHHTKHHQTYVDKLNAALEKYPDLQKKKVEDLLKNLNSIPEDIRTLVRNHGGGHLNHSFFWKILTPKKTDPSPKLKAAIEKKFSSREKFMEEFSNKAVALFGSGWCWLVIKNKQLEIITTPNQDSPISQGFISLIGLDLWEHAYYLKYQNKRADYISAFWNILNRDEVSRIYEEAMKN